MDTSSYSTLLWRRKWVIAGTFIVTMVVAALGTMWLTPTYEATATLRVRTAARGSLDWVDYDIAYTERLMNTYARLATSAPVLQEVAQRLDGRALPAISAQVVPDTELMTITARGGNPAWVAETANTVTAILVNQSEFGGVPLASERNEPAGNILAEDLAGAEAALIQAQADYAAAAAETPNDAVRLAALSRALDLRQESYASLLSQYERARIAEQLRASALSIVELATVPRSPATPNLFMNVVLGGLLGLGGGGALAVVFHKLDRRLYSVREVEEAVGLPVLATIGDVPQWQTLIFGNSARTLEMSHRLRTSLESALAGDAEDGPTTLLVTSAGPAEGKSMVATKLAIAMGQAGRRVALVEANLHRPALHRTLAEGDPGMHNEAGLTTVVEGKWTLSEALQRTSYPGVWALTSGPLRAAPIELLSSPWMAELIGSLESEFDVVVLDGPSILGVADASVLAAMADGVVLVVSLANANRDVVQSARAELVRMDTRLLGIVANRVDKTGDERFRRYYDRVSQGRPAAEVDGAQAGVARPRAAGSETERLVPAPKGGRASAAVGMRDNSGTEASRVETGSRPAGEKQRELSH